MRKVERRDRQMEEELITARCGGRFFYIEKRAVVTIMKNPSIWKVPGAPEDIRGIFRYEGKTAVFYKISNTEKVICAVLLSDGQGDLFGLEAEEIGEELAAVGKDADKLDQGAFRQIMPGVWEEKSDTSE